VDYLEATLLPAQEDDVLELDEVWTFVGSKKNAVWLWLALCRRTRQIVAWWYGERDHVSCHALWNRVPEAYGRALCYSDLWEAYQKVLPAEQHQACAKSEGETNHPPKGHPSASISPCARAWRAWCVRRSPSPSTCSGTYVPFATFSSPTTPEQPENTRCG
jgi:IS1 family transposase